jgi:chromatin remodeling complex protein RSC6
MSKSTKKSLSAPTEEKVETLVKETKVEAAVDAESKDNLTYISYLELQDELSAIQERLSVLRANLKKHYKLTSKMLEKMNKGRRQNTNPRSPTGFGKPCFVPSTLRTLLKLGDDECITRPTVTQKLYSYIKDNSLFDKDDKRLLRVNDNLSKALQLSVQEVKLINSSTSTKDKQGLNFYNIQKYVARLYPKQEKEEVKQVAEKKVVEAVAEKKVVEVVAEKKSTSAVKKLK